MLKRILDILWGGCRKAALRQQNGKPQDVSRKEAKTVGSHMRSLYPVVLGAGGLVGRHEFAILLV